MSNEQAAVVVAWKGDGTEDNPYTPNLPDLPEGGKWEDISTVEGTGVPGGSVTYTIRVTADTAFMDQLDSVNGAVVAWRENLDDESPGAQSIFNRPRNTTAQANEFIEFALELVSEGLYKNLGEVVQTFKLDPGRTWEQISIVGIVNQVAQGNGSDGDPGPTPASDDEAIALINAA